jgi:predicted  nucleic acid-binding Zn-ribbon protein
MSLASLEIQVSADIAELQKNLKDGKVSVKDFEQSMLASTNSLKKFEGALKKSTDPKEIKNLEASITGLKAKIETLNASQNNLLGSTNKMAVGTNQANNALTNLGRVAQDAPFGFIGIQNNLNPLLESFQRLKQETGSNVASFKALAGSLMGAGGLGLALSVVSSLYLVFGDSIGSVSGEVKRANAAYEDYQKTMASSIGTAQKEIAQSQALINIVSNVNNSTKDRTNALKQLQEQYPKNLELQKADINSTGILTEFQNKLSQSLIRRAKAQAFADLYAKESIKLNELQTQSVSQTTDKATTFNKALAFVAGMQRGDAASALIKYKSGLKETGKEITETTERLKGYEKALNAITEEQVKAGDDVGKESPAAKIIKDKQSFEQDLKAEIDFISALFAKRIINFDEFIVKNNEAYNKAIEAAIKLKKPDALITQLQSNLILVPNVTGQSQTIKPEVNVEPDFKVSADRVAAIQGKMNQFLKTTLTPTKAVVDETSKAINAIIVNTYSNGLAGIGDSIAAALMSGGNMFEGVFNGILGTFGEGLQQVGKQIIIGSKLLQGITKALEGGSFTGSLLGGIALVSLGGILKSIKIGKNAQGTDYWKGGLSLVGERGPEIVNLPRGASVTPNHELGSIGGGMDIQIQPVTVFRGTDAIIYFNRVSQLNNRI